LIFGSVGVSEATPSYRFFLNESQTGTRQLVNSIKNRNKPEESRRSGLTNAPQKKVSKSKQKNQFLFRTNAKKVEIPTKSVESNWTL